MKTGFEYEWIKCAMERKRRLIKLNTEHVVNIEKKILERIRIMNLSDSDVLKELKNI